MSTRLQRLLCICSSASAAALLAAPVFAQTGTLDQVSPFTNASFNGSASSLTWQAQVRAGLSGQLEGIELTMQGVAGAQLRVGIRLGDAWSGNPLLYDQLVTKPGSGNELIFIDMTASGITLAANDTFVIEMQGNDTGAGMVGSYVDPNIGPPLYPEPLYLNGLFFADGGWRIGFNTYMLEGGLSAVLDCGATTATLTVDGGTPNGPLGVVYGSNGGNFAIPAGLPCAGTILTVRPPFARGAPIRGTFDANGSFTASANVPQNLCNALLVDVIDLTTCETAQP